MRETRRTIGEGSGKLIIFGEHAVVYGVPALVAALGTGVTATARFAQTTALNLTDGVTGEPLARVEVGEDDQLAEAYEAILGALEIGAPVEVNATVHIPVGAGLGSSAALAVATARALATISEASPAEVERAVEASERVFHGQPSGIDQTASLRGGIFEYQRTDDGPLIQTVLPAPLELFVCQPEAGTSTAEMVAGVRELHERHPEVCQSIDEAIRGIVEAGVIALEDADYAALGELMTMNHGLLVALGVSTPMLNRACDVALQAGALGAKLTGAGGGGCVFAVAEPGEGGAILEAWAEHDWQTFTFDV